MIINNAVDVESIRVVILKFDPVLDCSQVVADVDASCRLNS
jgi:hypothetical protein